MLSDRQIREIARLQHEEGYWTTYPAEEEEMSDGIEFFYLIMFIYPPNQPDQGSWYCFESLADDTNRAFEADTLQDLLIVAEHYEFFVTFDIDPDYVESLSEQFKSKNLVEV